MQIKSLIHKLQSCTGLIYVFTHQKESNKPYGEKKQTHLHFSCSTSVASSLVRPFRIQIAVNHHHSNSQSSLSFYTLLSSILSLHLNSSLHYPGTLIYQCFLPLKPSILSVWVSVCYKHEFTHKPQLPQYSHLGLLLMLHHREWANTTHCLSNNNLSLPSSATEAHWNTVWNKTYRCI